MDQRIVISYTISTREAKSCWIAQQSYFFVRCCSEATGVMMTCASKEPLRPKGAFLLSNPRI